MPIADVRVVTSSAEFESAGLAQALADAIGTAIGAQPGSVWVRLSFLAAANYAENGPPLGADELPVFVTLLRAAVPSGATLAAEVRSLTSAVAAATGRPVERVHVEHAPPGAGRVAFGGRLIGG